jgi:hypothetical protein
MKEKSRLRLRRSSGGRKRRKGNKMRWFWVILSLGIMLWNPFAAAGAEDKGILVVDRFSKGLNDEGNPVGWTREKSLGPQSVIAVEKENGKAFVLLRSVGDAFGIKKEISFDIRKYPYLCWEWRAVRLPPKGDVRKRETDDQAGQIYVVFPKFPSMINSRSMGYLWDTLTPVGQMGTSTAYSKMKYVVLESGKEKLGKWICETRNVYEDYKKLFQEEPPEVGAVLLYINTQNTAGSGEIHYANIYFSATLPKCPKE